MPPLILQPPPFRVPLLDPQGQLVETWRRFFLAQQSLVTLILSGSLGVVTGGGGGGAALALGTVDIVDEPTWLSGPGGGSNLLFTQGSVIFAGPGGVLTQNNANFFWDNTLLGLGIGTSSIDPQALGTRLRMLGAAVSGFGIEVVGNLADADATRQADFDFSAASNTGAGDRRIVMLRALTDGSTAANRGGRLGLWTKADSSGLIERLRLDQTGLAWINPGGVGATNAVAIGNNPAVSGIVRIPYASVGFASRDRLNAADITLLGLGNFANDDFIEFGDNQQHGVTRPLGLKFYPGAAAKLVLFASGGLNLGAVTDPGAGNFSIASPGTLTLAALTAKSVLFAGTGGVLSQDNANFSYDSVTATLTVVGSGGRILKLGSAPAGSGSVSLSYGNSVVMRARLNASDVSLFGMGGVADDDFIEFGDNSQHAVSKPLGMKFYPGSGVKMTLFTSGGLSLGNTTDPGANNLSLQAKVTTYNAVATAGSGVPAIYGSGRSVAQTAAVASVAAYTVGAADGSFLVSANVLVTTATLHSFTIECAYTDEGNTARVLTFPFQLLGGTSVSSITNAQGAVPYEGIPLHLRCKAATTITIRTQAAGTYTTVVYNVEGYITQIG